MHRRDIKGSGLSIMAEINKSTTKTIKKKPNTLLGKSQIANLVHGKVRITHKPAIAGVIVAVQY